MTGKQPPIPPENRSHKGPGENASAHNDRADLRPATPDPEKQGQQANTRINTTHQGHQQDR